MPAPIRDKLQLSAGDSVAFDLLENGEIRLRKASPMDLGFASAIGETLEVEWLCAEDEAAYADL